MATLRDGFFSRLRAAVVGVEAKRLGKRMVLWGFSIPVSAPLSER